MADSPSLNSTAATSRPTPTSVAKRHPQVTYPSRRPLWVALTAGAIPLAILILSQIATEVITVGAALLIAGLGFGWGKLTRNPDPTRSAWLVCLSGELGLLLTRFTQNLSWISITVALSLLVAFFFEMSRGIHRNQTSWSLASNMTGVVLVSAGAAWGLTSVYPTMNTLAFASLPATGIASLLIAVPCKAGWGRVLMCGTAGGATSAVLTLTYLHQFPDLALAVPYAVLNPTAGIWVMTIGVGILSGILVASVDVLFPIPKAKGYHLQQLTLALVPTLFLAVNLYGLSRLITG